MRKISTVAVSLVFAAMFAVSAFAQAAPTKIGWIDTGIFADEKEGVTKYVIALKALDSEMKPKVVELQNLQAKLQGVATDLDTMQKNSAVPVNQTSLQSKQEEGQRLQREFDFKKKEYDAAVESRSHVVLDPISADIGKAIQDYAKTKGYVVILDIDKLGQAGAILALDQSANITKEFVAFYNTRPATGATAAAATPR